MNFSNKTELQFHLDAIDEELYIKISPAISLWKHGFNNFQFETCLGDITCSWCIFDDVRVVISIIDNYGEYSDEYEIYIEGDFRKFLYKLSCTMPDYDNAAECMTIRKINTSTLDATRKVENILNSWCSIYDNFDAQYCYFPVKDVEFVKLRWGVAKLFDIDVNINLQNYVDTMRLINKNVHNVSAIVDYLSEAY